MFFQQYFSIFFIATIIIHGTSQALLEKLEFDIFWVAGVFKSGTSMAHYMLRQSGVFATVLQKETFAVDRFIKPVLITCPPTVFQTGLARLRSINQARNYKVIGLILLREFPDWKVSCFKFWCDNNLYNCTKGSWSTTQQDTTFVKLNTILDGKLNVSRWHTSLTNSNFERYTYIKEALQFTNRLFILDYALLDNPRLNPLAWLTGFSENLYINTNNHRGTETRALAKQYIKMPLHIRHKLQRISYCECQMLINHGINFTSCGSFQLDCPIMQLGTTFTALAPGLTILSKP